MSDIGNWAFPAELRPTQEGLRFDLARALGAMVLVRAEIPDDAFTAPILGTERAGNGVVIREDGLVLTIGYLITEATTIWLTTSDGVAVPGHPLAYDQPTGFGLVQPLGPLKAPALQRGPASACRVGDEAVVAGHGGREHALKTTVFAKREFAGYWEYVLDEAIFTAPAHPLWGGAALIGSDGRLLGLGSLLVEERVGEETVQGNMMVPVELLDPIFDDLVTRGRASRPPRPWLGAYITEVDGHPVLAGLAGNGPAERAGLLVGDRVLAVAGEPIAGLADLFRRVWRVGPAGIEVPLTISRRGARTTLMVQSADRADFLKKPHLH